jgi:hypothetical protein
MRTENLVEALVADRSGVIGGKRMRLALAGALALGGLASLALFFIAIGVRPDIAQALATWRFNLKVGLVLLALLLAFGLCHVLSRPVTSSHPGRRLLPLLALAAAAVAIELVILPSASWASRLVGTNALPCLIEIPTLALAPLAALLLVLRSSAPASPARAGAAAGLLAAATGAALYAFQCFDDSPLFVATWYTIATALVTAIGALAGAKLLKY